MQHTVIMTENRAKKLKLELRRGVLVMTILSVCKQAQYGYSLKQTLNQAGIEIDEGTLYPLIRRLSEQGLLDSQWQHIDGRERRYYTRSQLGNEVLLALIEEWQCMNKSVTKLITGEQA